MTPAAPGGRWPLAAHVLALAACLGVVAAVYHLRAPYTVDDGLYATEAHAVAQGHWQIPWRFATQDPAGRFFPLENATHGTDGWYPYVKQPAYAEVLARSSQAFGDVVGLYVPSFAGIVLAAISAWLLASLVVPNRRAAAFWAVAASPVLVNGLSLWAHAPSAAAAGFATAGAVAVARHRRAWGWPALLLGTATGGLLRPESLLFGIGLAVGVVLLVRPRRSTLVAVAMGAVVAATAAAAYAVSPLWSRSIAGTVATTVQAPARGGSFLGGRLEAAWRSLLQGSSGGAAGALLGVLALVAVLYGAWVVRRGGDQWPRDAAVAGVAFCVLLVARVVVGPEDAITGLLAAWPLAAAAMVLVRWRSLERELRILTVVVGLAALAVLATEYRQAGGLEWGGRFFSPVMPVVAVLAVAVLGDAVADCPAPFRSWLRRGALVLAAAPAVAGLVIVGIAKAHAGAFVAAVDRSASQVIVTDNLPLPRMAWSIYPRHDWVLAREPGDVIDALAMVRSAGVHQVTLITQSRVTSARLAGFAVTGETSGSAAHRYGFRILHLSSR